MHVPHGSRTIILGKHTHTQTHTHTHTHIYIYLRMQDVQKRMVRFQNLTRDLFLTLQGHKFTVSSIKYSCFSCTTSGWLPMPTAGPRSKIPRWRRNRKRLPVCSVLRSPDLWLQCSVSFVYGLELLVVQLLVVHVLTAVLNRAQNSRCTVITDLNTSKRSTQKDFS
jgi:hypothetical protein